MEWPSGSGRFETCVVQENQYLLTCLRYIELNPVRAGMVGDPGDYRWLSYRAHAFGVQAQLWSPHRLYLELADSCRRRQQTWRAKIRHCANTGLVLGTEAFREQVQRLRS